MDLGDTLASDAAQEIVKALIAELVEVTKKIPRLWHRGGAGKVEYIEAEMHRSTDALKASGPNIPAIQARQEGVWEGRLRELLAEDPGAQEELHAIVADIKRQEPQRPHIEQSISASAQGAFAQGVMFGNIINHSGPAQNNVPGEWKSADQSKNDGPA
jgi:hypothetical protein